MPSPQASFSASKKALCRSYNGQGIHDLSWCHLAFDLSEELSGGEEYLPGPLETSQSFLGAEQIAGVKRSPGTKGLFHLPVEALFPHSVFSEGDEALVFHTAPTGGRQPRMYPDQGHGLPREQQQNKQ